MSKNTFVPRVNQLDSIQLDQDVLRLLRDDLFTSFQKYAPSIYIKYQPELDLIFEAAIWFGSVGRKLTTFGQELLLISYDKDQLTTSRLCLHFLLTVLPRYAKRNSEVRFISNETLFKIITYSENICLVLSFLNFFRFLKTGRKPTLIDWLLGLDYITIQGSKRREIGYNYMTRELLWGGFMELLGLILPMINYRKARRIVKGIFSSSKSAQPGEVVQPQFGIDTVCTFCNSRPTIPHHMGCGHVFCYYCLKGNIFTDQEFICPSCGAKAQGISPVTANDARLRL